MLSPPPSELQTVNYLTNTTSVIQYVVVLLLYATQNGFDNLCRAKPIPTESQVFDALYATCTGLFTDRYFRHMIKFICIQLSLFRAFTFRNKNSSNGCFPDECSRFALKKLMRRGLWLQILESSPAMLLFISNKSFKCCYLGRLRHLYKIVQDVFGSAMGVVMENSAMNDNT